MYAGFSMWLRALVTIICLTVIAACTGVQFHEKALLNDRIMSFDDDNTAAAMRQHMITPREGAVGGFSSTGAGGCSCK